jgi:adenylate cyclase
MPPEEPERRHAAFLSADAVGYSRLMVDDDLATVRALSERREIAIRLTREHGGRVVDSPGDNLLAEFPLAIDAVRCAMNMQAEIVELKAATPQPMSFRIGIHEGDMIVVDDRAYGTSINVAARLERLARPGGICISDLVENQVERELDVQFEDIGEQRVKNIPEPVHAWFVPTPGEERRQPSTTEPSSRPAIAVLPFDNLSNNPEQEYFADGICEELITSLAIWRQFPVIARNSSFSYKGQSIDVKQVGRELGAGYVVEGSVRRSGRDVRIVAQLIDAETGLHVWADRWDGDLEDAFSLQEEIAQAIAVALHPELLALESERARRRPPANLDAWDYTLQGLWCLNRRTREENLRARDLCSKALELDPGSVFAQSTLAITYYQDIFHRWTDRTKDTIAQLVEAAERCLSLDTRDPAAHLVSGLGHLASGDVEGAVAALRHAVERNPSLPVAQSLLGQFLAMSGHAPEGIVHLERAVALSPRDPALWTFFTGLAVAYFIADRIEESAQAAERSLEINAEAAINYTCIAAAAALAGDQARAEEAVRQLLRLEPDFTVESLKLLLSASDPNANERFFRGLRQAGLDA